MTNSYKAIHTETEPTDEYSSFRKMNVLLMISGALAGSLFVLGIEFMNENVSTKKINSYVNNKEASLRSGLVVKPHSSSFKLSENPSVLSLLYFKSYAASTNLVCYQSKHDKYCCATPDEEVECVHYCPESGWNLFIMILGLASIIIGVCLNFIVPCLAFTGVLLLGSASSSSRR